jgi:hypothetical protein
VAGLTDRLTIGDAAYMPVAIAVMRKLGTSPESAARLVNARDVYQRGSIDRCNTGRPFSLHTTLTK